MTFDEAVRDVYGVPLSEFVAARTKAARAAASGGDPELAKQIGALRKPSAAAAAVNALVLADRSSLARLTELHDEFADAQDEGDRDALQTLGAKRRALVATFTARARELVEAAGGNLSSAAADQVSATFIAAVADAAAAKAVASGCLVRALSADGFGPADLDDAVALPIAGLRSVPQSGPRKRPSAKTRDELRARAALKDAMRAATRANADFERADAAQRRSAERRSWLQNERDELRERLSELDERIAAAEREIDELDAERAAAEQAVREADAAVAAVRRDT
jgi:hypothetical protein